MFTKRAVMCAALLVGVLMIAAPAFAVSIPGCGSGEFFIFTQKDIFFEQGATEITGDVFSQTGKISVGAHNIIHGTVSAQTLVIGTDAKVDHCETNNLQGNAAGCGTVAPFAPAPACTAGFPLGVTIPAFPAACAPGTAISTPAGSTQSLAPGCYSSVRVGAGATLNLTGGANYFVTGEVRVLAGGTLQSSGGSATIVNKSTVTSEAGAALTDLNIFSINTAGNDIHFFNGTLLTNVVSVSVKGDIHAHTGSRFVGGEIEGVTATIQPITNTGPPPPQVCVCPPGTHFQFDGTGDDHCGGAPANLTCAQYRSCVPD